MRYAGYGAVALFVVAIVIFAVAGAQNAGLIALNMLCLFPLSIFLGGVKFGHFFGTNEIRLAVRSRRQQPVQRGRKTVDKREILG